jgi:transcription initiation factor IIE alpha subunit
MVEKLKDEKKSESKNSNFQINNSNSKNSIQIFPFMNDKEIGN